MLFRSLPSEDDVTGLLRALTSETWVHGAERVNRDLESLYFEVRRRRHET